MSLARLGKSLIRRLHRPLHLPPPPPTDHHAAISRPLAPSHASTCVRVFASLTCNGGSTIAGKFGGPSPVHAVQLLELVVHLNHARPMSSGAAAPAPAGPMSSEAPATAPSVSKGVPVGAQKVGLENSMMSLGFVYEPYSTPEPISFRKRWFTPSGWSRTKEDYILKVKNANTLSKLRKKTGYIKRQFYGEAFRIYKEVNTLFAQGDISSLQKYLTDNMHSTMENEIIKRRQSKWKSMHWELVAVVSIRTLRARMIHVDKNDRDKAFVQITLEFVTKQKYEAYNSEGEVVLGDKSKDVHVKEIWVFEKSLFHPDAYWRLCGQINL